MYIIEGLLIGFATLFIVGPVVIILINATLKNGTKSGLAVIFGIFFSDLIYAYLSANGLANILNNTFLNKNISIIGFLILFGFGISYLLKKEALPDEKPTNIKKTVFQNFLKGFSVNLFSPFVLSFWVLLSKYGLDKYPFHATYFVFSIVFGVLIIDFLKVFLAKKLDRFLHSNRLFLFYRIAGIAFIIFSLRLLYHFLRL